MKVYTSMIRIGALGMAMMLAAESQIAYNAGNYRLDTGMSIACLLCIGIAEAMGAFEKKDGDK